MAQSVFHVLHFFNMAFHRITILRRLVRHAEQQLIDVTATRRNVSLVVYTQASRIVRLGALECGAKVHIASFETRGLGIGKVVSQNIGSLCSYLKRRHLCIQSAVQSNRHCSTSSCMDVAIDAANIMPTCANPTYQLEDVSKQALDPCEVMGLRRVVSRLTVKLSS